MNHAKTIAGGALLGLAVWLVVRRDSETITAPDESYAERSVSELMADYFNYGYQNASYVMGVDEMANAVSFAGLAMIKANEGFRADVYRDVAKHPTIGYGHKLTAAERLAGLSHVTTAEAEALLVKDLTTAELAVNRLVTVPLNQGQYDALVDFVYNVGQGAFSESRMRRYLNKGNYEAAANEFGRWVYAGGKVSQGIVNRRVAEYNMFTGKAVVSV